MGGERGAARRVMRRGRVGTHLLLVCMCALPGCGGAPAQSRERWSTGFWFWHGSSTSVTASVGAVDVVFVHVGQIRAPGPLRHDVEAWLPEHIPQAREYWLVYRYEDRAVPRMSVIAPLKDSVAELVRDARKRSIRITGIQLDIDSPTAALPDYARFLEALHKELPDNLQISITALLDWFRGGTGIEAVLRHVDEFVPQFYDVGEQDARIASRIDDARWAPRFSRFGKRFRIGVSSFGRTRFVPKPAGPQPGYAVALIDNLTPLELGSNPSFELRTSGTAAKELVLSYRALRRARIGYSEFDAGDSFEFVMATEESVREAVNAARRMGPHCAGVLIFRWPAFDEVLAMHPDEVLRAAGVSLPAGGKPAFKALDGDCVSVHCVDLYWAGSRVLLPEPVRYRIRSSAEIEYFLPAKRMPVRMTSPTTLELALPPYSGRHRLYLGRSVSGERAEYTVTQE